MTAILDAKTVMQLLSAKTLTNEQMKSVAEKYASVNNFHNPWDEAADPTEYADWPTNEEIAAFFLEHVRAVIRANLMRTADKDLMETNDEARLALREAYSNEL